MEERIRQEIEYCKERVQGFTDDKNSARTYPTKRYYEGMAYAMEEMQTRLEDMLNDHLKQTNQPTTLLDLWKIHRNHSK